MLSQSVALPLALAASLASTAVAFQSPVLHNHGVRHYGKEHARMARDFAGVHAALDRRLVKGGKGRMQRKVRRTEGAMMLATAANATESSSTPSTSSSYQSTAIWWLQDGWSGACGTDITAGALQVALPLSVYPDASVKSSLCGTTVTVTAASTGKSIDCVVVGASERQDYTTFTQAAFTALEGDLQTGELAISFTLSGNAATAAPSVAAKVKATTSSEAPAQTTTTSDAPAKKTTTSEAPAATTTAAAAAKEANLNLAQKQVKTTTSAAPAATTSAAATEDGSDDDWVCDDDEDDSASTSSSSAAAAASTDRQSYYQKTSGQSGNNDGSSSSSSSSEWTAPSSTTTSSAPAQTSASSSSSSDSGVADTSGSLSLLSQAGVKGFLGDNSNAIISWYHTDSSTDSTNVSIDTLNLLCERGHSWCGFAYNDAVPGFAPSVGTMLNNFGGDYEAAAKAYCGLEAIVTTPDGKTATLYIADGFDDTWVRTPASIDVIYDSFAQLYGSTTSNKNDVVQGASWKLTGNRNSKYAFKSTTSLS